MKYAVPVLLVVLAIVVAGSLAWFFLASGSPGSAREVVTEQRAVAPFAQLAIDGFADVTLVPGDAEAVIVETTAKRPARVRAEVRDGTLTIDGGPSRRWWSGIFGANRPARVTVVFRTLEGISASGAVKLHADGVKTERLKVAASGATSLRIANLDTPELTLSGSGAMKAEIAGRAPVQRITLSGAASYRAPELASRDVRITVSGAGRVVVRAEKTLDVAISGAGSVEYIGNPTVTKRVSGAGKIERRDAAAATDARVAMAAVAF